MVIRLAQKHDKVRWDEYVLAHEDGVAYHQYGWLEAVRTAYGFRVYPLLAEKKGSCVGLLPLAHIRWPLTRGKLVSLPYCDLGGVLADSAEISEALLENAKALGKNLSIPEIEIRSAFPVGPGTKPNPHKVRMVLTLPESSEALFAGFKAKLRSQVGKPRREGLRSVLGGGELLDDFYGIFTQNMRDLGSPVHGRTWFVELLQHLGTSARIGVVYMPGGEPAAAGIILCTRKVVSIPWASSLRRFNHANPNMLLYWSFLAFAADNGFHQFDFGRSTPGEGTFKFKQQWGANPEPLYWQDFVGSTLKPATPEGKSLLRTRMEDVWKRMPLGVCNFVGPHVRRCVSL
jgi:FemAB-related protein (PEP-CTERM system-associated)